MHWPSPTAKEGQHIPVVFWWPLSGHWNPAPVWLLGLQPGSILPFQCSTNCGAGTQQRNVTCGNPQGRCDPSAQPPAEKPCEDNSGCYEWKTGEWAKVSPAGIPGTRIFFFSLLTDVLVLGSHAAGLGGHPNSALGSSWWCWGTIDRTWASHRSLLSPLNFPWSCYSLSCPAMTPWEGNRALSIAERPLQK